MDELLKKLEAEAKGGGVKPGTALEVILLLRDMREAKLQDRIKGLERDNANLERNKDSWKLRGKAGRELYEAVNNCTALWQGDEVVRKAMETVDHWWV